MSAVERRVAARRRQAEELAAIALAGLWEQTELASRLEGHSRLDGDDARLLAQRLLETFPGGSPSVAGFVDALRRYPPLPVRTLPGSAVVPVEPWPVWRWDVPRWRTVRECAQALDLTEGELYWFADARGWNRRARASLRHYRYRWVPTRSGGVRLLEQPKPRLAELQRRVVRHVLAALPVHDAAHGFRKGRSAATCAGPHARRDLVVRLDLEGFFAAVPATRLQGLLALAGYPAGVAQLLAGLLATETPADVLSAAPRAGDALVRRRLLEHLARPHLPQGAPSSPSAANAVACHLDVRLAGLARVLGATYTRYADDLAFSGDARLALHRLLPGVRRIASDEGFRLRDTKTSVAGAHQRQRVAGLVVNTAPAAPREDYDALRATLHNCVRTGPAAQNRHGHPDFRTHLLGRIAWVGSTHPGRAAKLRALYDRITW
ncbi:reverse transcriptase family protein [Prauserella cavernicola]|uniref:RNA-directed DNA polymerase n=1 Tax=Prauserella cavernicola TaxID=2800127 RepID=A0A934R1D5_9PSEU|nr:reverse transcriptase family protein [Prauserella cavernicola]MBK1789289.1 RNA-directed DNA polymerase [Prauserella cavernicola]